MLTLLTATGARPEAWAICQKLMLAQDYAGPVHWIIVDDGPAPQPSSFQREGWGVTVVRPCPKWQPGQNTQARNLLVGLELVPSDARLVVIEDDDAYAPDWLSMVSRELEHAELVGESHARYYNVATRRYRQLSNAQHASLCSTAMHGSAIDAFRRACERKPKFIDIDLWNSHSSRPSRKLFGGHRVVGIKGLPGRGGIGIGHRKDFYGKPDDSMRILREWVGDNAELYAGFYACR